ncbi:MAG: T9SS type A sorting domain-containing protein [Ignavibacteria bacterium]|nr:T9SS type A sorting domain-containing protein [Ignavibacteria bacterium]
MKNNTLYFKYIGILVLLIRCMIPTSTYSQLSKSYPGDVNISSDKNVLFSEMFEQSTVQSMLANWSNNSPTLSNIILDASSVPSLSPGHQCLRLQTISDADTTSVTPYEQTSIYKKILPGVDDSVFVRFYIKYDNSTRYHHSGVWMGGKNPPSNFPGLQAGYLSDGSKAFHVGTEVRGTTFAPANTSVYGFYNYWMGMHQSSQINPQTKQGYYWGNQFYNNTTADEIDMNSWNCVEVMIKLNNPVSASNGELALWINGVKISHYGQSFPNGSWNMSNFTEGTGSPFEGFQWRNNDSVKFNYVWLTTYVTNSVNHTGNVYFDHLVVAKTYIGPIATSAVPLPPSQVILTAPDNQSLKNSSDFDFSWSELPNTELYEIEVATDSLFKSRIELKSTTDHTYHLSVSNFEGKLYWHVRAKNAAGWGAYSPTWMVQVILPLPLPQACVLVIPPDKSVIKGNEVTLSWNASTPRPLLYQLQISDMQEFMTQIVDNASLTDSIFTFINLLDNTNYFWRVRAKNSTGWGDFSAVRSFTKFMVSSIQELSNDKEIMVFPNPTASEIIIRATTGKYSYSVYDFLGKVQISGSSSSGEEQINTEILSSGIYTLVVRVDSGEQSFRFVKK